MADFSPTVVEHFSNPRNVGELAQATARAFVGNPVCGDQLELFAIIENERLSRVTYLACGCATLLATGSVLTEALKDRRVDEVAGITEEDVARMLGGLAPGQRHCASMAVEALSVLLANHRRGRAAVAAQAPPRAPAYPVEGDGPDEPGTP